VGSDWRYLSVTPISLGIFASANTTVGTSFESIATVTVGSGGTTEINFTSIPSTYTHLQLRFMWNTTLANWLSIEFNSDTTTSNYRYHELRGTGSTTYTETGNSRVFALQDVDAATSTFGVGVTDILDYANTNKYKTTRNLVGYDKNGSGNIDFVSTLWMSTSAISSIRIFRNNTSAGNIAQYSHFALYGCKSA
jgi:hypothetical protein